MEMFFRLITAHSFTLGYSYSHSWGSDLLLLIAYRQRMMSRGALMVAVEVVNSKTLVYYNSDFSGPGSMLPELSLQGPFTIDPFIFMTMDCYFGFRFLL